jgi:hypothetical protein
MLITWRHSRNKDVFFDKRNKDVENSEIIQVYNNHDRSKFVRQCGGSTNDRATTKGIMSQGPTTKELNHLLEVYAVQYTRVLQKNTSTI